MNFSMTNMNRVEFPNELLDQPIQCSSMDNDSVCHLLLRKVLWKDRKCYYLDMTIRREDLSTLREAIKTVFGEEL